MVIFTQLEQLVVQLFVNIQIVQILENAILIEAFEQESFVWDFCVSILSAAFDVKGHFLIGFYVHIGSTFHDDDIHRREVLRLNSENAVYSRKERIWILMVMLNEIIQHSK